MHRVAHSQRSDLNPLFGVLTSVLCSVNSSFPIIVSLYLPSIPCYSVMWLADINCMIVYCMPVWLYLWMPHCALIAEDGWKIISKAHQSTRFRIADHKSHIVSQCCWYLLPISLDICSFTRELFHTMSGLKLQHWISNIFRWQHISYFKEAMSALTRELGHSPNSANSCHLCWNCWRWTPTCQGIGGDSPIHFSASTKFPGVAHSFR